MKIQISLLMMLYSSLASASYWCPTFEGKFPDIKAEVKDFQFFYFTDYLAEDGEQEGALIVIDTQRTVLFVEPHLQTYADWFSSLEIVGHSAALYIDSIEHRFDKAWIVTNGKKLYFNKGKSHRAKCDKK